MEVAFNNTGVVNVDAGTMQLTGGGTSDGDFDLDAGATLDLNNGIHNLNASTFSGAGTLQISGSTSFNFVNLNGGTIDSAVLISGGNLQGANHTITGPATWTGGTIQGAATTQFDNTLAISGAGNQDIEDGRVINATGTTTWSGNTENGNNHITFSVGTINNSGTWNDANVFNSFLDHFTGTNAFNNSGTYNKLNNTLTLVEVAFNNTGVVNVDAGTMQLTGNGGHTGSWNVDNGATLEFGAGTHQLNNGSSIGGDGRLLVSGGSLNFNGGSQAVSLGNLAITGGRVTMNPSLIDLSGELNIGTSGRIVLSIDGTNRSNGTGGNDQYSAVDAGSVVVDGALEIDLGFDTQPGDRFDIVTADVIAVPFNNIVGDVFLQSNVLAVVPSLAAGATAGDSDTLSLFTTYPGDTNFDFKVDAADLNILALNWQQTITGWEEADFDGNGVVNAGDLNLLAINWQSGVNNSLISFEDAWAMALANIVIPEPSSLIVLVVAMSGVSLRRRV